LSPAEPREERAAVGVGLMALAVGCFTGIDTSAKWLILAGLAPIQVVFVRYLVHFLIALAITVPGRGLADFRSNAPGRQLLRSSFLFAGTIFNFFALKYLPITLTTTMFFAAPIVITLVAIPLLGEQVGRRRIAAVCTGFLGVLIVVRPWDAGFHPAIFLSFGALICASGYFLMTRMLAGVESNATSQLWSSGLATICLAPFGIAAWVTPPDAKVVAVLVVIGTFGAVGHILATTAHRMADVSILAPVVYIQILLAAVVGVAVFGTWPTVWTLAGGLIIIASGLYIWHRERAKGQLATGTAKAVR